MMTTLQDSRRTMITKLVAIGVAAASIPSEQTAAAEQLDRFGGLKAVQFDASGFFRVQKRDRWWFVTPDGAAFLSFGLNHPNKDYMRQSYNIDHWKTQFGVDDANSPAFVRAFASKVMKDIEHFGMNTLGCHALKPDFGRITVPYIQGLFFARTAYWLVQSPRSFPDVFSDAFTNRCETISQKVVASRRADPYLMGYTFTNVPILTDLDADAHGDVPWAGAQANRPTWPRSLRNHGSDAPGKKVFVALMQKRYPDIDSFNEVYKTQFVSFAELLAANNWSPFLKTNGIDDALDNHAFLLQILERYYSVACSAVRKHDPHHLIFGDPLNANTPPPDDVVSLVSRHTDLIAYQFYGGYDQHSPLLDRWSKLTGKPLFHADSSFCVANENMPAPIGAVCPDQESRARQFLDVATRTLARPDVLGWNWCGWMDAWSDWKTDRQHTGLQDPFGRYHDPMPETMARFGEQIYAIGQRAIEPQR